MGDEQLHISNASDNYVHLYRFGLNSDELLEFRHECSAEKTSERYFIVNRLETRNGKRMYFFHFVTDPEKGAYDLVTAELHFSKERLAETPSAIEYLGKKPKIEWGNPNAHYTR